MRMHKRFAAVAMILVALFSACATSTSTEAPFEELVDVGTHKLHIRCTGSGRPTIVIDTGIGETAETWESIIEA